MCTSLSFLVLEFSSLLFNVGMQGWRKIVHHNLNLNNDDVLKTMNFREHRDFAEQNVHLTFFVGNILMHLLAVLSEEWFAIFKAIFLLG